MRLALWQELKSYCYCYYTDRLSLVWTKSISPTAAHYHRLELCSSQITVTKWSQNDHMMVTWCSHGCHMTWNPLYLQDLVEFKEQHNVSLTTHSDESEILTHSQLHSTLSSALGELVDPACWTHSWVTRYSSVVRSRGIVAHKGYVHKWSFK